MNLKTNAKYFSMPPQKIDSTDFQGQKQTEMKQRYNKALNLTGIYNQHDSLALSSEVTVREIKKDRLNKQKTGC